MKWLDHIRRIPGTIVSAAAETINLFPFDGALNNLVLVTAHRHPWVKAWRNRGLQVYCLEEHTRERILNTRRLLLHPDTMQFLRTLKKPVRIFMFKPSADIEKKFREHDFSFLHPPAAVSRRLENKIMFPQLAEAAGLKIPSTHTISMTASMNAGELFNRLGKPFVLQTAKGFSGHRTFLVDSDMVFNRLKNRFIHRKCRISQYIIGDTWTVNACVDTEGKVQVGYPFYQITETFEGEVPGEIKLGSKGNIWKRLPSMKLENKLRKSVEKTGKILNQHGFVGVFGMDFIISDDQEYRGIEINPRIVASLPTLTPLEMKGDIPPLALNHIHVSANGCLLSADAPLLPGGGQRIIHEKDPLFAYTQNLKPGLYKQDGSGNFAYISDGYSTSQLDSGRILVWKTSLSGHSNEKVRITFLSDSDNNPSAMLKKILTWLSKLRSTS